jgi:DNA-binding beta-propeller fold protein YncE
MGLIFTKGKLDVVNQNVNQPFNGEILQYHRETGSFQDVLVSRDNPNAPWAPHGLIRGSGNTLYVADHDGGAVKQFNAETGEFIANLDTTGFTGGFFPRSIVRGPDDLLYVSVTNLLNGDRISGHILRFNPQDGKFVDVFTNNIAPGCATHLHRPEGLVFSPDGKLYVTSFRIDANDTDRVLVYNGKTGECVDEINLDQVGGDRTYAQALLFGPKGKLFVPINNTGDVRRYNVKTKTFDIFIAAGGFLKIPWYLTFGKTDPRTLEYDD